MAFQGGQRHSNPRESRMRDMNPCVRPPGNEMGSQVNPGMPPLMGMPPHPSAGRPSGGPMPMGMQNSGGPRGPPPHPGGPPPFPQPRGPPPFRGGPRGPPPHMQGSRGPPPHQGGPRGPPPQQGPPPHMQGSRGPPPPQGGPRGPPPQQGGPRGHLGGPRGHLPHQGGPRCPPPPQGHRGPPPPQNHPGGPPPNFNQAPQYKNGPNFNQNYNGPNKYNYPPNSGESQGFDHNNAPSYSCPPSNAGAGIRPPPPHGMPHSVQGPPPFCVGPPTHQNMPGNPMQGKCNEGAGPHSDPQRRMPPYSNIPPSHGNQSQHGGQYRNPGQQGAQLPPAPGGPIGPGGPPGPSGDLGLLGHSGHQGGIPPSDYGPGAHHRPPPLIGGPDKPPSGGHRPYRHDGPHGRESDRLARSDYYERDHLKDERSHRRERSDSRSRKSPERRPRGRDFLDHESPKRESSRRGGRNEMEPRASSSKSLDSRSNKYSSPRSRYRDEPRGNTDMRDSKDRYVPSRRKHPSPPGSRDGGRFPDRARDTRHKRPEDRESDRGRSPRSRADSSSDRSPRRSRPPRRERSEQPENDKGRRKRSRSRSKAPRSQDKSIRPRDRNKTPEKGTASDGEGEDSAGASPSRDFMDDDARYELLSNLLDQEVNPDEENQEIKVPEETEVISGPDWMRCSPADLYFRRDKDTNCMVATKKMIDLEEKFESELIKRAAKVRETKPPYVKPPRTNPVLAKHMKKQCHHHPHESGGSESESSSSDDDSDLDNDVAHGWMEELNRKQQHPERLHQELWFNEPGEMNDGPLCRCNVRSCNSGIRHDIYPGENRIPRCVPDSNNQDILYHYRITMSPHTNFLTKNPTVIEYDNHEYIFEGFSILSHYKLENVPVCRVIRFNIEYTIHWFEEEVPENFSVRSLDLFSDFFFYEILELLDLDWKPKANGCSRFHLMPRFARDVPDNGKEILSMNEVLLYLLRSAQPLLEQSELNELHKFEKHEWQSWVDKVRGMIVTFPGMRPSSIRIDQLDREQVKDDVIAYPVIIHFGIRPAQLSYAGDPYYQKLWKQYVKFKHLLANKPKITLEDKTKLERKEDKLQEMRMKSSMKREVTVELCSQGFIKTGIKSDMCQHAMLLPVLIVHLRFHKCLDELEKVIKYQFKDRMLLQLALTHPSYRVNFGTNPDHARNSLSNCGIRHPEYGDRRIHHVHTRKRGINTLINIMSRLGRKEETVSEINHYERLEFLGDAVVEFMSSIHLFYMFPSLEEGGLATYRAAIVQNQHLAVLAKKLKLQEFMLYAHGPDLCHESDLRHAMANCLEALMGALFLDEGIELADRIFGEVLYDDDVDLLDTWQNLPVHPLQEDEPNGDRQWIASSPALQKLRKFEDSIGMEFTHVRLLARSFTMRNVGYNNLTFGHNQRLEFLGDTVLQLIASDYLFKHFPEHHEGHLSLLRSSLVNNRTQAVVCDDLGMTEYIIHADNRLYDQAGMKHKEKADLLEAFLGALYVDKGLEYCRVFCSVCFFPRLKQFILNQDWNDPKSQLQQCCLTLRELGGEEPDIPVYKVIASTGPTNTRKYTVAVYFRGERLATGTGHSIQQSEMNAATNALADRGELFPQLAHQKKFIEKKYKRKGRKSKNDHEPRTKQIRNKSPPRKNEERSSSK